MPDELKLPSLLSKAHQLNISNLNSYISRYATASKGKEARRRSQNLSIHTQSLPDIHFPAQNVVAMLVHENYGTTIRKVLDGHNIVPLNFDPYDSKNLNDSRHDNLHREDGKP
ncbi:hypothetical protein [Absidia glauca]|uniref:Uncharacterized protein n=1 Tax=Absidia glauca TaxID=4829 RepID=A0A168PV99_ABSGL|nr:hypothetical protein [Absidia glauca]